ncbi:hypothetical protein YC2023_019147 [Brassica napus]
MGNLNVVPSASLPWCPKYIQISLAISGMCISDYAQKVAASPDRVQRKAGPRLIEEDDR